MELRSNETTPFFMPNFIGSLFIQQIFPLVAVILYTVDFYTGHFLYQIQVNFIKIKFQIFYFYTHNFFRAIYTSFFTIIFNCKTVPQVNKLLRFQTQSLHNFLTLLVFFSRVVNPSANERMQGSAQAGRGREAEVHQQSQGRQQQKQGQIQEVQ